MNAIAPIEPATLVNIVARAASDPGTDVGKLQALIELQERVLRNQARAAYMRAMARVAEELEPVKKDEINPSFNKGYATLSAIDAAIRPIYSGRGFSVSYGTTEAPSGSIGVSCTVSHEDGYSETLSLQAPLDTQTGGRARTAVQAVGSTVSYLRRYLVSMAFNITTEDDDGEASRRTAPAAPSMRPRRERPEPQEQPALSPAEPASWLDTHTARLVTERDMGKWQDAYEDACATAPSQSDLVRLHGIEVIKRALERAPGAVKVRMTQASSAAFTRLTPTQSAMPLTDADTPYNPETGEITAEERLHA